MLHREPTTEEQQQQVIWETYRDRLRALAHQVIEHGAELNPRELNMVKFMIAEMLRIAGLYEMGLKCITTALYREGVLLGCREGLCHQKIL